MDIPHINIMKLFFSNDPYYILRRIACKCSFRTITEQEMYGSYCSDCWNIIKIHNKCILCDVSVEKERLYVDTKYKLPTCEKCYLCENFDMLMKLKTFVNG